MSSQTTTTSQPSALARPGSQPGSASAAGWPGGRRRQVRWRSTRDWDWR